MCTVTVVPHDRGARVVCDRPQRAVARFILSIPAVKEILGPTDERSKDIGLVD